MARTRKRTKTKLISFLIDEGDNLHNYFGFKVVSINEAKQFLAAVKKLENAACTFTVGNETYEYALSYFNFISLASAEQNALINLFDLDIEDESSNNFIGIIPNAIEDAYDEGLMDEQYEDEESEEYEDEEY